MRNQIVKQAQEWIGRKESNGTHKAIIDVYNSRRPLPRGYAVKYTDEWCATFASAVAIKCGATDIIPIECSCPQMISLFKSLGSWIESDAYVPQPGDFIFYDWQDTGRGENYGDPEHVGIVEKVAGNNITIIEGNYSQSVKRRVIKINDRYIRGFGAPKYKAITNNNLAGEELDKIAKDVIQGKYGSGAVRKKKLGANYDKVQTRVNELLLAEKIERLAKETIQGKYGTGKTRERKLGSLYKAVQKRVNEMLK